MKENMEDKEIKVALCLSGLIRNSYFCFPYIYDSFLNQGFKVDTFIHTWENEKSINLYRPQKYQIENRDSAINHVVPQLKIPKGLKVEGNMNHNISMYYSIKKCFDLVPDDYQIVIRCRFDLLLQDKIDLLSIIRGIVKNEYDIFIPGRIFNVGGYNDQLAIGSYQTMKIYSNCILHFNDIIKGLNKWHPESFLGYWLDKNNIRVEQDDYDYRIVRNYNATLSWPEKHFNVNKI